MKHLLFLAFLAVCTAAAQAQITYVFTGATATGAPANITAGSVTQVNNNGTTTFLAAGTPASTGYTGASGGNNGNFSAKTGSLNTSTSTYLQAVLTPATGYWINLTAISWGNFSISTTGPTTLSVYTSIDNYASPLATATVTHSATNWTLLNPTFAPISGFTSTAVTIRIYASGGTGTTPAAGAANWRVDDLKITATAGSGTVGQLPKYSNLTSFTNSIIYESPAGNIGVGTSSPAQKLDVNGHLRVNSQISNPVNTNKIHFQYDANNGIGFQLTDGNAVQMVALAGNNYLQAIGGSSPFHIGTWPAKPIKIEVGSTRAMVVQSNGRITIASETDNGFGQLQVTGNTWLSGNLGIGTAAAPAAKLDVAGTFKLVDGTQGAGKVLTSDAGGNASWQTPAGGGGNLWTDGGSGNLYNTTQAGSIAIGLPAAPAGYKLAVAGNIIAEKVKTRLQASGWPDYVFNTGYHLPTLAEVERFIKQNRHLPGVPSAAEVDKNGLDLGDNQAVLLKKIEELTLYMIQMSKNFEKLAAENENLKKQLTAPKQ